MSSLQGHPMRRRSWNNGQDDDADPGSAIPLPKGRSVLGNVSNTHLVVDNGEVKSKSTRPSRSTAAVAPSKANDLPKQRSCRVRSSNPPKEETHQNHPMQRRSAQGTKVVTKATMSPSRRPSKRTRLRSIYDETTDILSERVKRHKKARVVNAATRKPESTGRNEGDDYLIHPDFRLQRESFDRFDYTNGIASHDIEVESNVLEVAPYVTDILQHFFMVEGRTHPNSYMDDQADINARMRAILIDWLVEVHMKFRLVPETLYLCVNLIDRYCSVAAVRRSKLQLVGVTALLIACKYEEIYPPEVRDCVYITDRAYQRQEVLEMEQEILNKLRFRVSVPTAYPFLQRFLRLTKVSPLARVAAQYYMERTLQEYEFVRFRPSLVAASAVLLALSNQDIVSRDPKGSRLRHMLSMLLIYTGFKEEDVLECAAIIAQKVGEEPVTASKRQLVAVKRKFGESKFLHVSTAIRDPTVRDLAAFISTSSNK